MVKGTEPNIDNQGGFVGAPQVRSVFIYHVSSDATETDLSHWLKHRKVEVMGIRVMSHPDAFFKSFKVTVPKERFKELISPDFKWPLNVRVRSFVPASRGNV